MPPYELSWPANSCWLYVKALRTEDITMQTLSLYTKAHALPAWSGSAQMRRKLQPQKISTLLTLRERRGGTDEECELIEMRYQQAPPILRVSFHVPICVTEAASTRAASTTDTLKLKGDCRTGTFLRECRMFDCVLIRIAILGFFVITSFAAQAQTLPKMRNS
jgi:hypothetical protein